MIKDPSQDHISHFFILKNQEDYLKQLSNDGEITEKLYEKFLEKISSPCGKKPVKPEKVKGQDMFTKDLEKEKHYIKAFLKENYYGYDYNATDLFIQSINSILNK